jgi:hypothetical protein|tara:strand:- start:191 stop:400 length:210 start_codon:yes stop_codon:yes gene_type:complete
MNKLINLALFADQKDGGEKGGDIDFFEDAKDIKPVNISQRAQRNLESKLFQLLTNSDILEDIEIISAQN